MSSLDDLKSLVGEWEGDNLVWLSLDQDPYESKTGAKIDLVARGKFLRIDYSYAIEDEPQEGSLIIGHNAQGEASTGAWVDSWHNGDVLMVLRGQVEENGSVNLLGSYPAESGPDWGWRIVVEPGGIDSFRIFMYNITPQGVEALAVEADYRPVR